MATFAGVTFTEKGRREPKSQVSTIRTHAALDWGKTTREEIIATEANPLFVYCGTKILAELAAWKFAEEHRALDLATGQSSASPPRAPPLTSSCMFVVPYSEPSVRVRHAGP